MQEALIVGEGVPAQAALEARRDAGTPARAWIAEAAGEDEPAGSSAALARCLVELEAEMQRERPQCVVAAGDSDAALAGAIVAAKLLIPVESAPGEAGAGSVNAELISRLAGTYTPAG